MARPQANRTQRCCPVCDHAISRRRLLASPPHARWRCPRCGSTLTFEGRWHGTAVILLGAGLLLIELTAPHARAAAAVGFVVLGVAVSAWATRVAVVVRNRGFCRSCRYDLRGTLDAGGTRCPECGAPATQRGDIAALSEAASAPKQNR